jgi:DNA ligase-1
MKAAYDAIIACRKTSSKNDKRAILEKNKNDAELREFLRVCYEPRINFYMKKIDTKNTAKVDATPVMGLPLIKNLIEILNGRFFTGNRAKTYVSNLYNSFKHDWERELLTMLIERDVKAGFSESTINTIWEDTVTDVPYMRCSLPKDAKLDKFPWKDGVFSQIKADGMFANISHFHDGEIRIESRNGSPFPLDHFHEIVEEVKLRVPRGHQTHGELLMLQKKISGYSTLDRQTGNGMFNKILKDGEFESDSYTPMYEAWDIIPIEEAKRKNKYKVPYSDRYAQLRKCIPFSHTTQFLAVIETKVVYSYKEAVEHYRDALERGLEGTIIKSPAMIWEDSTSKFQVKMKLEFECDLVIVGWNEGKNKYEGMLGSWKCESACGRLKVNVAGFKDEQRQDYWENREDYFGKIITVKSNSIMPPTNKEHYSLFLPIWVEDRLDKKEADDLERVIAQYEASIEAMGS